ncbi:MAG: nuclease, partial [Actinobacteria bacterium]|nr:nuclease [Actinomycetota bacterium]
MRTERRQGGRPGAGRARRRPAGAQAGLPGRLALATALALLALTSCGGDAADSSGQVPLVESTTSGQTTTSDVASQSTSTTSTTSTTTPAPTSTTAALDPWLETIPLPLDVPWEATALVSVTDGDTLQVKAASCSQGLRLIGINTPEDSECLAAEATTFLQGLVAGRALALVRDVSELDQHGRCLRYVWAGDVFVNEALVRSGLAIASRYPPDVAFAALFAAAQAEAQQARRGMWARNACGPATGAVIEISAIEYNPPGDDTLDLNAEYVTLTNAAWFPVDLTGWVLKDQSATHRFRFPE